MICFAQEQAGGIFYLHTLYAAVMRPPLSHGGYHDNTTSRWPANPVKLPTASLIAVIPTVDIEPRGSRGGEGLVGALVVLTTEAECTWLRPTVFQEYT
jgi:hypothetical protein